MEPKDLKALSPSELIERVEEQDKQIQELKQQIEALTNPPPNDWHSWFYILLRIVLHRFEKDNVKVLREVVLGAKPVKLLKELGDCVRADAVKGIYHVENWKVDFPI